MADNCDYLERLESQCWRSHAGITGAIGWLSCVKREETSRAVLALGQHLPALEDSRALSAASVRRALTDFEAQVGFSVEQESS